MITGDERMAEAADWKIAQVLYENNRLEARLPLMDLCVQGCAR